MARLSAWKTRCWCHGLPAPSRRWRHSTYHVLEEAVEAVVAAAGGVSCTTVRPRPGRSSLCALAHRLSSRQHGWVCARARRVASRGGVGLCVAVPRASSSRCAAARACSRRARSVSRREVGARLQREVRRLEVVVVGDLDAHEVAQRVGLALQSIALDAVRIAPSASARRNCAGMCRLAHSERLSPRSWRRPSPGSLAEREVDLRGGRREPAQRGEQAWPLVRAAHCARRLSAASAVSRARAPTPRGRAPSARADRVDDDSRGGGHSIDRTARISVSTGGGVAGQGFEDLRVAWTSGAGGGERTTPRRPAAQIDESCRRSATTARGPRAAHLYGR